MQKSQVLLKQDAKLEYLCVVVEEVVISEFAELNKVQKPNLWPYGNSFVRMLQQIGYQIIRMKCWYCEEPNKCGCASAAMRDLRSGV